LFQLRKSKLPSLGLRLFKITHGYPKWLDQPLAIRIDTQNRCNLKCTYCNPQGSYVKGKVGQLPMTTIQYVLNYFRDRSLKIAFVKPYMNGEPLLEPRLKQIAQTIVETLGCRVEVYTNGSIYKNRELLRSPYIDTVKFTISAGTQETYNLVHGRDLYYHALHTLRWLQKYKFPHQRIVVNFVQVKENVAELPLWRQNMKGLEQNVLILHEGTGQHQSASVEKIAESEAMSESSHHKSKAVSLDRLCSNWGGLDISFDGNIMECCDAPYKYNYGSVLDHDILEIWKEKNRLGLDHPACKHCNLKHPNWRQIHDRYVT
jgi:MoaA/NifB/PqqE/SkfB family radical SAM enzyme